MPTLYAKIEKQSHNVGGRLPPRSGYLIEYESYDNDMDTGKVKLLEAFLRDLGYDVEFRDTPPGFVEVKR